jgi:dTDP-4-amino-4,6-dideoxygalactose transaminase
VHLYGNPAAMTQIIEIAQAHGLKVIEDCAQSFGARYSGSCSGCDTSCSDSIRSEISGKMTGAIGDVGAYSFFPSKNLGAYGDGGLIATNDDAIADLARMLRVHGAKKKYHNEIIGYNSRLDTLQAAILRVKLPHIDEWNSGRRRVASLYTELLADIPEVVAPEVVSGHVFHQYTIRIIKGDRDKVASDLSAKGISTMIYYPIPQDRLPIYAGKYPVNPISDQLGTQVLSLPIWPELDRSIAEEVIGCLRTSI